MLASAKPRVTVAIATYNRPTVLASTVRQLLLQPFSDFELVVVDQSDSREAAENKTFAESCGDKRIYYVHIERKGLPNARNIALGRAEGDVILFVDDDVVLLSEDFVGAHLRYYDDPSVGGVTGRHVERILTMNSRKTACHVSVGGRTIFNLFGTRQQEIGSCKGSNMSFRMGVVQEVGGFDRRTHMLEDTDFSVRVRAAGWRLLFAPDAEVLHLSIPAGGVREAAGLETQCQRFKSTAYFVAKHRGAPGILAFSVTFSLIGLKFALQHRQPSAIIELFKATMTGLSQSRLPPDQSIRT